MKAVIVEKPGKISIKEIERPKIGEYECLVRVKACAICNGTDTKIVEGKFPFVKEYPVILGHEGVGEVIEVGKKVRNFKEGDLVLEPFGRNDNIKSAYGHFAEYAVVGDYKALLEDGHLPPEYLKRQQIVPSDIDVKDATMLLTLKETLSGLHNFGFKKDMSIIIFGDGPVGGALARFAKLLGARLIIGVGHWEERLQKMKYLGADYVVNGKYYNIEEYISEILDGRKVDMVIDAVGKEEIINMGLKFIHGKGKVGVYGVITQSTINIKVSEWPNMGTVQMLYFPVDHDKVHERVIEYVREGDINLKDFYSHVIKMDQIEEGFKLIKERKAYKVVVEIE